MEQVFNEKQGNDSDVQQQHVNGNALSSNVKSKVEDIPLESISVSKTNTIFRRPHELTPEALGELVGSIQQHGVIQPILVRPDKEREGKVILICGERRFTAAGLAGLTEIPAYVRDVPDNIALILQITENIQRENVHPLNEAKGYRVMMEADQTLTTAELALRFGKSETYIIQRLKLNDLIKDAKKDFYEGRMHLGHAIIICRLLKSDQKEIVKQYSGRNGYGTVADLESYVQRNVMNNLSAAPFDKNDDDLLKKAGSCLSCPKRSGASPLLFAEIKQKDQCFDRGCFFQKCELFLVLRVRKAIETEPDLLFLSEGYHEPNQKVLEMITEHKLKVLKQYDDFNTHEGYEKSAAIKGLWITGTKAGHIAAVYLKKAPKQTPAGSEGIPVQIEKIKHRMERGRELDREKVYAKILEALKVHPSQKKTFGELMIPGEEVMLWYIIFDKAGYNLKNELLKFLGISKEDPEKLYNAIKTLKGEERAFMLRRVMMDQYGGNYPDSAYGFIIHKIAAGYGDIDIPSFQKEQLAIAEKRETRASERIAELKRADKALDESKSNSTIKRKSKNKKAASSNKKRG